MVSPRLLPIFVAFSAHVACDPGKPFVPPDVGEVAVVDAPAAAAPLVIVTINLRCLIDDWDARLPLLAEGLIDADPDVIGVQEVCAQPGGRDALEELVAALAARGGGQLVYTRTMTHRAWDAYDEGLAILSRHPIAAVHVEPLPAGAIPRKLVAARVLAPGGDVAIAATHLDHQGAATRAAQAAAAADMLDRFAPGAPAMLVGDLNEGPGGGVTSTFAGAGFTDAWAALHPGEPGFTFPSSAPAARIDYVWTRGDVVRPVTIERIFTAPAGAVFASDHVGLRTVVTLQP